jgi:putative FmdB family regulatory protein
MPIYEYVCNACGRRVEVRHGMHGHGPAVCETCGGSMRKAPSAPAIHFKGTGWAKKDAQASSSGGARSSSGSGSKSGGTASEPAGSDSGSSEASSSATTAKPVSGNAED